MSNTQEKHQNVFWGETTTKLFVSHGGLPVSVAPGLVDGEGKVTKYCIKEIKLFAVCLFSNPDRTVSKWHFGINHTQEEVDRRVDEHDMPCQKSYTRSIMSIKNAR